MTLVYLSALTLSAFPARVAIVWRIHRPAARRCSHRHRAARARGAGASDRAQREVSAAGKRPCGRPVRSTARPAGRRACRGVRRQPRDARSRRDRHATAAQLLVGSNLDRPLLRRVGHARPNRGRARPPGIAALADLFRAWGEPLSTRRLAWFSASSSARVAVFVNGRRWRGSPSAVTLEPHSEIVLEVGPYVPPHRSYTFPPGR